MLDHKTISLQFSEAVQTANEQFRKALLTGSVLSPSDERVVLKLVLEPAWRPLCELMANGFTSYEGALLLHSLGLIRKAHFRVRSGVAVGRFVECVDITEKGSEYFDDFCRQDGGEGLKGKLIDALQSYAAIDSGAGIVATRSAFEGALEHDDWEMMERLRCLDDGPFMFLGVSPEHRMPSSERGDYLELSTSWDGARAGAELIRLFE